MKQSKVLILILALLFVGINVSNAQDDASKDEAKKEIVKLLVKDMIALNLTEDQKPSYKEISKRYGQEMKGVKESGNGKFKKFKAMKDISKRKNEEMRQLLTKDQYTLYLEQQEELKEEIKENKKNN